MEIYTARSRNRPEIRLNPVNGGYIIQDFQDNRIGIDLNQLQDNLVSEGDQEYNLLKATTLHHARN